MPRHLIFNVRSLDFSCQETHRLRAIAHLDGIGRMKKYVKSKGMYNPKDQLFTSLQDYHDKFSEAG